MHGQKNINLLHHVNWWIVANIFKDPIPYIFRVKQSKKNYLLVNTAQQPKRTVSSVTSLQEP